MRLPYGALSRLGNAARCLASPTPTYVVLFVTSRCNARCRMCFNWRLIEGSAERDELSADEYRRIASSLGHVQQLTLSGGEPSLRDDLVEVVGAFYERNAIPQVTFPTNGMLPERIARQVRELCEACPRTVFKVSVSIDGVGALHDRIRGVEGSFESALRTYDLLDELRGECPNFTLSSCTTLSALNQHEIGRILEFKASRMRLDSNGITLARGDVRDPAALELSEGAYEGVLPELALRYAQMTHEPESWALRAVYQMTAERVLARLRAGRRAEPCCAGRRSVVITDVGDVQACEPLTAPLGSLRESGYDVMRVLRSDRARHVLASIQARECTCTWECAIASSIVFTPGEYPRVLARILRNAVAFARRPRHGTSRRAGGPGPT